MKLLTGFGTLHDELAAPPTSVEALQKSNETVVMQENQSCRLRNCM
jgi:hypothetical protein